MPLTTAERKHRMPFGAQKEIAAALEVTPAYVSRVLSDDIRPRTPTGQKQLRRIRVAIARRLGMPVDEVFPPPAPDATQEAPPAAANAS
jgi:transcriptional regulator with XRE-family HTH domain